MDEENLSGFDAGEQWLWEQEQLRADPAYSEWLDNLELTEKETEHV
jgi:hypothetical protein